MKKYRLVITTGDTDGIGLEISVKAINKIGRIRNTTFYLVSSSKGIKISKKLKIRSVSSFKEALAIDNSHYDVIHIILRSSPAHWVRDAAIYCKKRLFSGMVTAPLSKTEIKRSGLNFIGHTEILKSISKSKNAFMAFRGPKINIVLATGHVGIKKIVIKKSSLYSAVLAAEKLRNTLPKKKRGLPIGVIGLNPHCGEDGLIGSEEKTTFLPIIERLANRGIRVEGPLVPDVIFAKSRWTSYSVIVAAYHDQGLIPFKMLHGFSDPGVHLTLGIPFVRTSVDHGTAKDIFGENKANPQSMIAAIGLALNLIRKGS
ncbi:MAG: hypothetical protein A4S09_14510 [Proteobacteria bacterium SG_bin7]|nr:MAG: hypothetical protein A4S09_14510 [Proteobacteria bacterium SG_bin7]